MKKSGFTLLELSIVLVIIGLIVGGVLTGRDLIQASQIRSVLSDVQSFNTAAVTFRTKYGALPGDILPQNAAAFGLFQLTGTYTIKGFENNFIDASWGNDGAIQESYTFWRHLSEANLIAGSYGMDEDDPINPLTGDMTSYTQPDDFRLFTPAPRVNGMVQYYVSRERRMLPGGNWSYLPYNEISITSYNPTDWLTESMPIGQAYLIDLKIDDGLPNQGKVLENNGLQGNWAASPAEDKCTYGGSSNQYAFDTLYNNDYPDSLVCSIYMKAGF